MTNLSTEVMEFINSQVKPDYQQLVEIGEQYQQDSEYVKIWLMILEILQEPLRIRFQK